MGAALHTSTAKAVVGDAAGPDSTRPRVPDRADTDLARVGRLHGACGYPAARARFARGPRRHARGAGWARDRLHSSHRRASGCGDAPRSRSRQGSDTSHEGQLGRYPGRSRGGNGGACRRGECHSSSTRSQGFPRCKRLHRLPAISTRRGRCGPTAPIPASRPRSSRSHRVQGRSPRPCWMCP